MFVFLKAGEGNNIALKNKILYFGLFFCIFRIRTETNGGAWCPAQPVSSDTYEFLQVDLGHLKVITLVETQGRFGNGQVSFSRNYVVCSYIQVYSTSRH